jgi:large subunit ribosomal protein L32
MGVPKRRSSHARRNKRRSHDALPPVQTSACPNCGAPRLSHRVCPSCGFYKGTQVTETEAS